MTAGPVLAGLLGGSAAVLCIWAGELRRADRTIERLRGPLPGTSDRGSQGGMGRGLAVLEAHPAAARAVLAALAGLAGFLVGGPVLAIAGLVTGAAVPVWRRRRREERERALADDELAEAAAAIAAGLRAGLSTSQAIHAAAREVRLPLAAELEGIVRREALGMSLADSLGLWEAASPGRDVRLTVSVLRLHGRTGGDLPKVLDRLAATLRERRSAAREIRSHTAQARLSGGILGFLPVGFFLFLAATSRDDMDVVLRSGTGIAAISLGLVLQLIAFMWIRRLLRVEG